MAYCYTEAVAKQLFCQHKGREGHKIALDEWVEAYLVQPLKNYATGKLLLTKTNVARY